MAAAQRLEPIYNELRELANLRQQFPASGRSGGQHHIPSLPHNAHPVVLLFSIHPAATAAFSGTLKTGPPQNMRLQQPP